MLSLHGQPQAVHSGGSGLNHRHHLDPAEEMFPLNGRDHGSVFQEEAQLDGLEQH